MLNTSAVFDRLNLGQSAVRAVQSIRESVDLADDKAARANKVIHDILGIKSEYEDPVQARLIAMAVGEEAFKVNHEIADEAAFLKMCEDRIVKFMADPSRAFMFMVQANNGKPAGELVAVEGTDVKVEMKANGKIKKGGKQVIADDLWTKHVINATGPITNQEFIAILKKAADMSDAGASTYAYNARKKLGVSAHFVEAKKGRKAAVVDTPVAVEETPIVDTRGANTADVPEDYRPALDGN